MSWNCVWIWQGMLREVKTLNPRDELKSVKSLSNHDYWVLGNLHFIGNGSFKSFYEMFWITFLKFIQFFQEFDHCVPVCRKKPSQVKNPKKCFLTNFLLHELEAKRVNCSLFRGGDAMQETILGLGEFLNCTKSCKVQPRPCWLDTLVPIRTLKLSNIGSG